MHCYCCDTLVGPEMIDRKTDRYYCPSCFEATNEILLANLEAELRAEFNSDGLPLLDPLEEDLLEVQEEDDDDNPWDE